MPPSDHLDLIMGVMERAFDPAFGEAWNRRQVEDALLLGNCHYGLAMAGEDCAGFYLARNGFGEVELLLLAVDPLYRRRGYARQLLEDLVVFARTRNAERLLLEMRDGNPAEYLYQQFGFGAIGARKNYYQQPGGSRGDAITFSKPLV
jgi:ribosomal-protein-alanine N-acetyltransferase